MAIRAANKPVLTDGYATAIVTKVSEGTGYDTKKRAKDADGEVESYERFEVSMAMDGTTGPIRVEVFVGTTLNGAIGTTGKGKNAKPVYNRLSQLVMGLGVVTATDLEGVISGETLERVEKALHELEGAKLRFKLGKVEGRPLPVPILDTVERVMD